jgi:hypothetical protein
MMFRRIFVGKAGIDQKFRGQYHHYVILYKTYNGPDEHRCLETEGGKAACENQGNGYAPTDLYRDSSIG